jgi:hypothetical protein
MTAVAKFEFPVPSLMTAVARILERVTKTDRWQRHSKAGDVISSCVVLAHSFLVTGDIAFFEYFVKYWTYI